MNRRASPILEIGRNFGDFCAESLNGYFQSPLYPLSDSSGYEAVAAMYCSGKSMGLPGNAAGF